MVQNPRAFLLGARDLARRKSEPLNTLYLQEQRLEGGSRLARLWPGGSFTLSRAL